MKLRGERERRHASVCGYFESSQVGGGKCGVMVGHSRVFLVCARPAVTGQAASVSGPATICRNAPGSSAATAAQRVRQERVSVRRPRAGDKRRRDHDGTELEWLEQMLDLARTSTHAVSPWRCRSAASRQRVPRNMTQAQLSPHRVNADRSLRQAADYPADVSTGIAILLKTYIQQACLSVQEAPLMSSTPFVFLSTHMPVKRITRCITLMPSSLLVNRW